MFCSEAEWGFGGFFVNGWGFLFVFILVWFGIFVLFCFVGFYFPHILKGIFML